MSAPRLGGPAGRQLLRLVLLQAAWAAGSGPLQYSVPEEAKAGTLVGRLAQDLGLEAGELAARRLRLVWKGGRDSLEVKAESGALVVQSRLDREELCGQSARCALHLEVLVDKPLRVFHVEVEIQDINDNAPVFSVKEQMLSIAESRLPGSRFPLEVASDADIGINALLSYKLSPSEYFSLDVQNKNDKRQSAELVLSKSLDREETPVHHLLLTATDGGKPALTGTVELVITVLDVNDNAPVFSQAVYEVSLPENAANGTLVIKLNATDLDEGVNAEVRYSFKSLVGSRVKEKFSIDSRSGEIKVKGALDFEDMNLYEIHVQAADQGHLPLSGHCRVVVALVDVNDNAPELWVTPLSVPVAEDAAPGTVVALIRARDRDSGANGAVTLWLRPEAPFRLVSSFRDSYSLVLAEALDRERVAAYEVEPKQPNPDWRYSASLRAGMQSAVHMEEAGVLRGGPGGPEQQWPTVSSATPEPEAGEVSPPVGAGVNSNSWTFKFGPGNPKQGGPGELPDKFIIPGSPAIISIRQEPQNNQIDKSDFITFGKKEETKKKKKKKKGNKTQEKKEKGNSTTDNSDQ